jgi:hypothetical protein
MSGVAGYSGTERPAPVVAPPFSYPFGNKYQHALKWHMGCSPVEVFREHPDQKKTTPAAHRHGGDMTKIGLTLFTLALLCIHAGSATAEDAPATGTEQTTGTSGGDTSQGDAGGGGGSEDAEPKCD